ncbi:hypothetical protein [Microlunatus parietis]|uniref:Uncharacterized protein n=1 Tax=Microlunatus parietis TaxID=682979 RepID=A0A7Y9IEA8_9ACTN|nr:hypothetical protein [Microlunatus parietis]NYE75190.1 hypothetical protein [Microlunatus parietis]
MPNAVAATAVLLGMCPLAWLVVALPAFHPLLVTIDDCTVRVFLGRRRLLRMAGPDRARPERRRKPLLRIVGWSVSAALPLGLAALYSVTGHLHLIGPTVGWIAIMLIVIAAALALVPRSVFHLVILRPGVEPLHPRVAAVLLVDYLVRGGDPGRLGTGITLGELRVPATFVDGTATTEFS